MGLLLYFFVFFRLHLRHMEVPRLGVESELQPPAYTTATATWYLSRVFNLDQKSRQSWTLNPLSLGTSICHRCSPKKQKSKQNRIMFCLLRVCSAEAAPPPPFPGHWFVKSQLPCRMFYLLDFSGLFLCFHLPCSSSPSIFCQLEMRLKDFLRFRFNILGKNIS